MSTHPHCNCTTLRSCEYHYGTCPIDCGADQDFLVTSESMRGCLLPISQSFLQIIGHPTLCIGSRHQADIHVQTGSYHLRGHQAGTYGHSVWANLLSLLWKTKTTVPQTTVPQSQKIYSHVSVVCKVQRPIACSQSACTWEG